MLTVVWHTKMHSISIYCGSKAHQNTWSLVCGSFYDVRGAEYK